MNGNVKKIGEKKAQLNLTKLGFQICENASTTVQWSFVMVIFVKIFVFLIL